MFEKRLFPSILVIACGLILSYKLIFGGALGGYDAPVHVLWAQQFIKGFNAGNLYPSWLPDVNGGAGSPTFVYYPPFVFYTYLIIGLFVKEATYVVNLSAAASIVASGLAICFYARLFFGRTVSVLVGVVYMAMPYHLLTVYQRNAMAELWAFAWLPLILYFSHRSASAGFRASAGLAVCYAGLIMTHLPTVLLFTPFLLAYAFLLLNQERSKRAFLLRLLAIGAGVALSSVYLLPAMLEQGHVNITHLTAGSLNVANNFLFSELTEGRRLNRDVSLTAVSSLLPLLFLAAVALRRRMEHRAEMLFFAFAGVVAVFMMTPASGPFWKLPAFRMVQVPWRLTVQTSLYAAMCSGGIFCYLKGLRSRPAKVLLSLSLAAVILINGFLSGKAAASDVIWLDRSSGDYSIFVGGILVTGYRNDVSPDRPLGDFSIRADMPYEDLSENYFRYIAAPLLRLDRETALRILSETFLPARLLKDVAEYRPLGANIRSGAVLKMHDEKRYALFEGKEGDIEVLRWEPEDRLLRAAAKEPGPLLLRTFYYPGWRAYVDRSPAVAEKDPKSGLISLALQPGAHEVSLVYEGTRWQKAGKSVSLIALILLTGYSALERRRRRHDTRCREKKRSHRA